VLVDMTDVAEAARHQADQQSLEIGASVTLAEVAAIRE